MQLILLVILLAITCYGVFLLLQNIYRRLFSESKEVETKIVETTTDVILIINREYEIVKVINYSLESVSVPLDDILEKSILLFVEECYQEKVKEKIDLAFGSRTIEKIDFVFILNGKRLYYRGSFKRINDTTIICRGQNTTKSTLFEQELIQTKVNTENIQKIQQIILNNSSCGFVYIDTDFIVQFENLQGKKDFNLKYEVGECCYRKVKNRNIPCEDCLAAKALHSKTEEKVKVTLDNEIYFEITATPVLNRDSACLGVILKYENIAIQENTIKGLQQAKELAEAANKLKIEFLNNMSHEIRTPLNAIVGFSNLLIEGESQDEKKEYISIVKHNNELLLRIFNDIFMQAQIDSGTFDFTYTDVDLNGIFKELETNTVFRLEGQDVVEMMFYSPLEECIIRTDSSRLSDVLSHLIDNAIKFTKQGKIKVGYKVLNEKIFLYVSDTGIGIPKEKQVDIFKRFVKLNDFQPGTGLGLTICETIVKKLNGEIGVESIEGKGSTFWITLPLHERAFQPC